MGTGRHPFGVALLAAAGATALMALDVTREELCVTTAELETGEQAAYDVTLHAPAPPPELRADANYDTLPNRVEHFPTEHQVLLRWELGTTTQGTADGGAIEIDVLEAAPGTHYALHQLLRAWSPTQATWLRASETTQWGEPGAYGAADFSPIISGTVRAEAPGPAAIELTDEGLRVVNGWLAGTEENFGFVLRADHSPEALVFANSGSGTAPQLTLHFAEGGGSATSFMGDTTIVADPPTSLDRKGLVIASEDIGPSVALLRFDVPKVPKDAVIVGADLRVHPVWMRGGTLAVTPLLRGWSEERASWESADEGTPWSAPGAAGETDHGPVIASVQADWGVDGVLSVPFTDGGVVLVRDWAQGRQPNHGLRLAMSSGGAVELTDGEIGIGWKQPALCVQYRSSGIDLRTGCGAAPGNALTLLGVGVLLAAVALRRQRGG